MVALKLRTTDMTPGEAVVLGDIPFRPEAFETAVSTIKAWGVAIVGVSEAVQDEAFGQFVVTDNESYFEVVIEMDGN